MFNVQVAAPRPSHRPLQDVVRAVHRLNLSAVRAVAAAHHRSDRLRPAQHSHQRYNHNNTFSILTILPCNPRVLQHFQQVLAALRRPFPIRDPLHSKHNNKTVVMEDYILPLADRLRVGLMPVAAMSCFLIVENSNVLQGRINSH